MLFEQFIEFEVRGPGPPGRTCTSTAGNFYDKTKTSLKYLRVDYYLVLKYFRMQRRPTLQYFSLPRPNRLQNLTLYARLLNVFWTEIASKMRIEQSKFFNCFSNVKNLVLSNGSEHVRNVIQWH